MIWMGLFMAPGLPLLNLVKLVLMFYLKSSAVLVTNVPHETVFKASENGNFYLFLLLMMLFLCILPVAYTLVIPRFAAPHNLIPSLQVILKPSWHCGPFSDFEKIYLVSTTRLLEIIPHRWVSDSAQFCQSDSPSASIGCWTTSPAPVSSSPPSSCSS